MQRSGRTCSAPGQEVSGWRGRRQKGKGEIKMTAEKVLDTARAEIGTTEYPAGSNRTKYGRAYGMDNVA